MAGAFAKYFFKRRLDEDYVSRMQEYMMEMVGAWQEMGSFWQLPG